MLFVSCNLNVACQADRVRSFGRTLVNSWNQMQILFECCLYSLYTAKKMELYFYIVGPKRVRRTQYCERATSPSFEVLAYLIRHRRFFDHLPKTLMCAFECYFRFLALTDVEVLVEHLHAYFRLADLKLPFFLQPIYEYRCWCRIHFCEWCLLMQSVTYAHFAYCL